MTVQPMVFIGRKLELSCHMEWKFVCVLTIILQASVDLNVLYERLNDCAD